MASALIGIVGVAAAWTAVAGFIIGLVFRRDLRALWCEPVLRFPVLIVESDDWGPGPQAHAEALHRLAQILSGFLDRQGRHPVMTLGMVLAIPDAGRMRQDGESRYYRRLLSEPEFAPVRQAIETGIAQGVFAPQLHGMEHYWPPALLAAAQADEAVRRWLEQALPRTEDLPPHLQSRWADASSLPSRQLSGEAIDAAVEEEVRAFAEVFGFRPEVVVPPTFLWNAAAEKAWAEAGVQVLVTPGECFEARDGHGRLMSGSKRMLNGERGEGGIVYLVRNDYFEPAKGHRTERVIAAMESKHARGRPTLLETHRFNFTGTPEQADQSCRELGRMLAEVLRLFPEVRFMTTAELAQQLVARSPELVETRFARRLGIWLARIRDIPRFWKLAVVTGAALPLRVLALGQHRWPE